jgi:hypothetical protein
MIATKIGIFAFRVHFDLLKLRFSPLLFHLFLHKIVWSLLGFTADRFNPAIRLIPIYFKAEMIKSAIRLSADMFNN